MMSARFRLTVRLLVLTVTGVSVACSGDRVVSPGQLASAVASSNSSGRSSSQDDPNFLTASPSAPSIANPVISFWAKKGTDRSIRMVYTSRPGHNDSTTFLYFRVRAQSLVSRADGTPLANGDSVLITVTLVDPVHLKVDFQPSGLRFSQSHPATLKMSYAETAPFSVSPGVLKIWRRESPLTPWLPLTSQVLEDANEVTTDIGGFTGYAIAY